MVDVRSTETEILKAEKAALVVIDLQKGIAERPLFPHTAAQVIQHASQLVEAFAAQGAFVALVRVSTIDGKDMVKPRTDLKANSMQFPEGWDCIVPELTQHQNVHIITKRQWGAFYGTDLDLQLRRRGIDTIVLCGVSTAIGVDTTAREAFQHGYNQIFVEDAMAASTREEHDYVCKTIFPRIGRIRTTAEVLECLSHL